VTVTLQAGQSGVLDMAQPRSAIWAEILDSLRLVNQPAYLVIDPQTSVITDLLLPRTFRVGALTPTPNGDAFEVELIVSHARHYLRRSNPDFQDLFDALEAARRNQTAVLVTESLDGTEIIDVRPAPNPPEPAELRAPARPAPAPRPADWGAPVSAVRAQELFDLVSGQACSPTAATSPCIPFMYPDDGCWARAHAMCHMMIDDAAEPEKVWIYGNLRAAAQNHPNCHVYWNWHVAPTLQVSTGGVAQTFVIDPSLFPGPVPLDQWKRIQGDPEAVLEPTAASVYTRYQGGLYEATDPTYANAESTMVYYRNQLMLRSAGPSGPPPYAVCLVPDIYLRDNLLDTGVEPLVSGGISSSPDINHYRQSLANPQAVLGTLAAERQDNLFEQLEVGQDNFIYLRLQNRGCTASAVDIDLYYSEPSTLPTPNSWNLIGSFSAPAVAPGEFKVAGPLVWSEVPERGHYCFVAVLGTPQDPKPNLSAVHTIGDFQTFIRGHNNVTWKNFDTDDMFAGSYKEFSFSIQGWPRQACHSDLEIDLSALPAGSEVMLRVLKRLVDGGGVERMARIDETERHLTFAAQPGGTAALRAMPLHASDSSQAILGITLPDTTPDGAYQLSVLQKVGGVEMGRVTKRLIVGQYPYVVNSNTDEVHLANCEWVAKMNPRHRVAYRDVQLAVQRGYNGCHYCLPELDTD
jgi:hypothetical protein